MTLNLTPTDDNPMLPAQDGPRDGYWMATYTGRRIYFNSSRPEDFNIDDIAHGLSNNARYSGQSIAFYSVAEHCWRGSMRARDVLIEFGNPDPTDAQVADLALEFLLHDGSEAYLGDMVHPLKLYMPDYQRIEDDMQRKINIRFNLPPPMSELCRVIDRRMLRTEAPMMFPQSEDKWWNDPVYPQPFADEFVHPNRRVRAEDSRGQGKAEAKIWDNQFMPPRMAKRLFLERFKELRNIMGMPA